MLQVRYQVAFSNVKVALLKKKPLHHALLTGQIRPLFPSAFQNETQVICTVIGHDGENDPDMVAMVGASAALAISRHSVQWPHCRRTCSLYRR